MKTWIFFLLFILGSSCTFAQATTAEFAPNHLIVKFKAEVVNNASFSFINNRFNLSSIDELNQKYGLAQIKMTGNKKKKNAYLLQFQQEQNIDRLISEYQSTGYFEWVEPNFIGHGGGVRAPQETIPDDSFFGRQWGLLNDGDFSLSPAIEDADIDMELAWDIETGNSSIIVAVLDSGFKLDHPEFAGRIWTNPSESSDGNDSDSNGYTDDVQGWDFVNNDNDPTDDHGHGTNVAGIIAANADNGNGYAGVDWNCKVMIGKILNQNNSGFYNDWTDAMYYSVDNGARVINMSVGGPGFSQLMKEAAEYAYSENVTIVVSMMNFDNDVTYYPAGYETTMAIGSTDPNDNRTSPFFWSNTSGSCYGEHIDVVAPGNYIYGLSYNSNTNFGSYWGGTSQSAPLVTGLASLLLAQDPTRTPDDIRTIIRATAEDEVGNNTEDIPGWDEFYGWGRINAFDALNQIPVKLEELPQNTFSVYPNPANGAESIFINFQKPLKEKTSVTLLNQLGQIITISDLEKNHQEVELSLSNIPTGTYFLKVHQGDNIFSQSISIK